MPGQVTACHAARSLGKLLRRGGRDDAAALLTPTRAQVDHPVCVGDHVQVVLDDEHAGAVLDEPVQDREQDLDVQGVQPDARLVQDEHRALLGGAEVGGQLEPLGLTARQRRRRLPEREVTQSEIREQPQPTAYLRQVRAGLEGLADRQAQELGKGQR